MPIHKAAKYGIYDFVKMLIEYGADVNAVDRKRKMPLNYVENRLEEENFLKIYELLKDNGADNDWKKDIKKDEDYDNENDEID